MVRIIDWNAVGSAAFQFFICGVIGIMQIGSENSLSVLLLPISLVGLVVMIQKLIGVVFDFKAGTIRFYSFWTPRTVYIDQIKDANCEFGILVSPTRLMAIFGGGSKKRGRSDGGQRTYMVNLSGTFGSRQVRFHHKRWRDRFLSVLRDHAPRCRITRWS